MRYSLMFKSIKLALLNTYRKVHIMPIIITFFIVIINKFFLKNNKINFDVDNIGTYLTGLSILSTFFIFSIQGINFKYVNENFNKRIWKKTPLTNKEEQIAEGHELRCTCYSLSVISFALIFFVYILIFTSLFKNYIDIIFLFTIIYIFNALLFTLSIWNETNTK